MGAFPAVKVGADRVSADPAGPGRGVVALLGLEPNSILAWLREMDLLRQALEVAA